MLRKLLQLKHWTVNLSQTNSTSFQKIENDFYVSDVNTDILKMVVINRYKEAPVSIGFVKNFGLKKGAIASSVAHDSHNIIAVGADDESICKAVNLIIENRGGISCIELLILFNRQKFCHCLLQDL